MTRRQAWYFRRGSDALVRGREEPTPRSPIDSASWRLPMLVIGIGLLTAYWRVAFKLVVDWWTIPDYSHGFLIVPLALYFAWDRREELIHARRDPANFGLLVVLAGLAGLALGTIGAELFVARLSLIVVLAGSVVFLMGWRALRILAFPLAFLVLMIPLPSIVFNQIAFPLQLLASSVGEAVLWCVGIPVLRQGNVITLATTSLEVAEACSGIRSLVSLLTLTIVYCHLSEPRRAVRMILLVATVPIAIVTNGLRVAALGFAAHWRGPSAAEGWFHSVSGWIVFVAALGCLVLLKRVVLTPYRLRNWGGPRPASAVTTPEIARESEPC